MTKTKTIRYHFVVRFVKGFFMSKLEKIKEQLNWLKLAFGMLIAVNFSLVGWMAQNYANANNILVILSLATVIVVTIILIYVAQKARLKIDELEDL
jgi:membrane protein YdbS with pleckstrin-like domain